MIGLLIMAAALPYYLTRSIWDELGPRKGPQTFDDLIVWGLILLGFVLMLGEALSWEA